MDGDCIRVSTNHQNCDLTEVVPGWGINELKMPGGIASDDSDAAHISRMTGKKSPATKRGV